MNQSFQLLSVAGIPIRVHITFIFILLLGAYQWGVPYGWQGAVYGVILMILLFACVVLHELGHAVAARRFGVGTKQILLMPLGGLAVLEKLPPTPFAEFVVALAGPMVNVLIATLLWIGGGFVLPQNALEQNFLSFVSDQTPTFAAAYGWLLTTNVLLVVFNLIPAFPLDGGRVLRAILAAFLGQGRGTMWAARIGQTLAVLLGLLGLASFNLALLLIGVFIYVSANQENNYTQAKVVLSTRRVGDVYNKHAIVLRIGDRVSTVVDYLLTSYQPDFAVLQAGKLLGIVRRDDVLKSLADETKDQYVQEIMEREVIHVPYDMPVDEARELMGREKVEVVAVYAGNAYLGLINLDDLAEAYTIIRYLQRQEQAQVQAAGAS